MTYLFQAYSSGYGGNLISDFPLDLGSISISWKKSIIGSSEHDVPPFLKHHILHVFTLPVFATGLPSLWGQGLCLALLTTVSIASACSWALPD